jgi:hypothetical protein
MNAKDDGTGDAFENIRGETCMTGKMEQLRAEDIAVVLGIDPSTIRGRTAGRDLIAKADATNFSDLVRAKPCLEKTTIY